MNRAEVETLLSFVVGLQMFATFPDHLPLREWRGVVVRPEGVGDDWLFDDDRMHSIAGPPHEELPLPEEKDWQRSDLDRLLHLALDLAAELPRDPSSRRAFAVSDLEVWLARKGAEAKLRAEDLEKLRANGGDTRWFERREEAGYTTEGGLNVVARQWCRIHARAAKALVFIARHARGQKVARAVVSGALYGFEKGRETLFAQKRATGALTHVHFDPIIPKGLNVAAFTDLMMLLPSMLVEQINAQQTEDGATVTLRREGRKHALSVLAERLNRTTDMAPAIRAAIEAGQRMTYRDEAMGTTVGGLWTWMISDGNELLKLTLSPILRPRYVQELHEHLVRMRPEKEKGQENEKRTALEQKVRRQGGTVLVPILPTWTMPEPKRDDQRGDARLTLLATLRDAANLTYLDGAPDTLVENGARRGMTATDVRWWQDRMVDEGWWSRTENGGWQLGPALAKEHRVMTETAEISRVRSKGGRASQTSRMENPDGKKKSRRRSG